MAGQFDGPGSRQIHKKDERTFIHTRSGQLRHLFEGVQVEIAVKIGEKLPAKLDQRRKNKLKVEGRRPLKKKIQINFTNTEESIRNFNFKTFKIKFLFLFWMIKTIFVFVFGKIKTSLSLN
jgi:hypothetical protein